MKNEIPYTILIPILVLIAIALIGMIIYNFKKMDKELHPEDYKNVDEIESSDDMLFMQ